MVESVTSFAAYTSVGEGYSLHIRGMRCQSILRLQTNIRQPRPFVRTETPGTQKGTGGGTIPTTNEKARNAPHARRLLRIEHKVLARRERSRDVDVRRAHVVVRPLLLLARGRRGAAAAAAALLEGRAGLRHLSLRCLGLCRCGCGCGGMRGWWRMAVLSGSGAGSGGGVQGWVGGREGGLVSEGKRPAGCSSSSSMSKGECGGAGEASEC